MRDPGRRPPPEPTGTAIIRGRVVAADTGSPIRRATVNLSMTAPPPPPASPAAPGSNAGTAAGVAGAASSSTATRTVVVNGVPTVVSMQVGFTRPKSATTDAQGAFEFRDLAAGAYRLTASPGQYSAGYLSMNYGAKKPNAPGAPDPGTSIDLADGQTFDKATIALPRGAVITGRVTDDNGDPLVRVQVYTIAFMPGSSRGIRTGGNASTDDLGQFRIFGLAPGEYTVAAEARGNTFVGPNAPPESEQDKIGFMQTFYPGTADEAAAQHVRTKTGAETSGIEIRMISGRLFHVTGMVVDSQGRFLARANGTLFKRAAGGSGTSTFGFSSDEQGRFQMRSIPPGNYRLTVRQPQNGPRIADGSPPELGEFASMPVTINSDLDDILVTTSPGVTITGTVAFENGPPPLTGAQQSFQMRVSAGMGDPESMAGTPTPPPALVSPDLTFTIKGLSGEVLLRSSAPNNVLKAVLLGGEDITDTPHEFKPGDRVTLVLTSNTATLDGAVTDGAGKPVTDAAVILFGDDKASWRSNSVHTRRGGPDQDGRYRMMNVLPGRYFLVALPRERMNGLTLGTDPSAFEALSKEAITVVVGADEHRQVDVKISPGGGGH